MANRQKGGRVNQGRDPETELRRLQRRFEKVSSRLDRPKRLRRMYQWTGLAVLIAFVTTGLYVALVLWAPWSPVITLRHIASFPNCTAARWVGLAPAMQGEPGYWPGHDRDKDGEACEPWPRRWLIPGGRSGGLFLWDAAALDPAVTFVEKGRQCPPLGIVQSDPHAQQMALAAGRVGIFERRAAM